MSTQYAVAWTWVTVLAVATLIAAWATAGYLRESVRIRRERHASRARHPAVRARQSRRITLTEEEVFWRFGDIVEAERKRERREQQR